mmetsp:Transcript_16531/g.45321  ORF Transcript_16531/g.45321 Transcript_16531/m.45321 type:complete len:294 (-) Transcript_16531:2698-3579(-)
MLTPATPWLLLVEGSSGPGGSWHALVMATLPLVPIPPSSAAVSVPRPPSTMTVRMPAPAAATGAPAELCVTPWLLACECLLGTQCFLGTQVSSCCCAPCSACRRCLASLCSCCCCCWILALALLPFPFPPLPPPASALDALLPPEPLAVGAEGSRCVLSFVMPRSCAALMPSRMCFSAFRLYVRSAPRSVSRSSASNGTASTTAMRGRGAGRGCPSLRPPALAPELLFPAEVALTPSVPASAAMAAAAAAAASASAAAAASGTLRATKYRVCLLGDKYREMTLTSGGSPPEAS